MVVMLRVRRSGAMGDLKKCPGLVAIHPWDISNNLPIITGMNAQTAPTLPIPSSLVLQAPSPAEADQLDRQGFVVLPGIIDPAWRQRLAESVDGLRGRQTVVDVLRPFQVEDGSARLANLVDEGPVFDGVWNNPRVLGCVQHVLKRGFKLSSLNAREPLPDQGHQGLHADWGGHGDDEPFHVVNSLWLLDPYTADNGATRLVPGSHRIVGSVVDLLPDRMAAHPEQIVVEAPAGSVVVFNAHAWHGGTVNRSGARRRVIHGYYTAREHGQQQDQRAMLSEATKARFDVAQRWILNLP